MHLLLFSKKNSILKLFHFCKHFSLLFATIMILTACATTTKIVDLEKSNYGLIVKSSYNGNLLTIDKATSCLSYKNRIYYFNDKTPY